MNVHKVYVNNHTEPYIIDDYGLNLFNKYTWFATHGEYPYLRTKVRNGNKDIILKFHIEIMKDEVLNYAKEGSVVIVDHIDGNVFNNTRNNLRVRTQSENNMNKQLQKNNTTGIVGVSWNVKSKMWTAYITKDRKRVNLGHYYYLRNAVKARVDAEDEYFGEHSYRNRDENYRDYIDSLLNLPNKEEPFIIKVRSDTTVCVGVSFLKSKNKYRARIEENGKVECVLFDSLDDAVRWRKLKDIEYYGNNIIYSNKKIDREI